MAEHTQVAVALVKVLEFSGRWFMFIRSEAWSLRRSMQSGGVNTIGEMADLTHNFGMFAGHASQALAGDELATKTALADIESHIAVFEKAKGNLPQRAGDLEQGIAALKELGHSLEAL